MSISFGWILGLFICNKAGDTAKKVFEGKKNQNEQSIRNNFFTFFTIDKIWSINPSVYGSFLHLPMVEQVWLELYVF